MHLDPSQRATFIERLVILSPLARHVLEGEKYRLMVLEEEIDDDAILQELTLALRDDLATIGLYFTCLLSDLYTDFVIFEHVLKVLEYILPNGLYPKLREKPEIQQQIKDILSGGIGNESTILLYLRWLGNGSDCYAPECSIGCAWLASRLSSTLLFNTYFTRLLEVQSTLTHPIFLHHDEIIAYTAKIRHYAQRLYDALDQTSTIPEIATIHHRLRLRMDLFIRHLLQPHHVSDNAWLWMTDRATLSDDLQGAYDKKWKEFESSQKLYGAYYSQQEKPLSVLSLVGIALRVWVDLKEPDRKSFLQAITNELPPLPPNEHIALQSLLIRLVDNLTTSD